MTLINRKQKKVFIFSDEQTRVQLEVFYTAVEDLNKEMSNYQQKQEAANAPCRSDVLASLKGYKVILQDLIKTLEVGTFYDGRVFNKDNRWVTK